MSRFPEGNTLVRVHRYLTWTFIAVVLVIAPNLVWLGTSTVRIYNAADSTIDAVAYVACETSHHVGTLRPHQSVFRFLPACGDDTLEIVVGESRFCQTYVEGELYHVEATIDTAGAVSCRYGDPLSSLFVAKALW